MRRLGDKTPTRFVLRARAAPYPNMVRDFQSLIGPQEQRASQGSTRPAPDVVMSPAWRRLKCDRRFTPFATSRSICVGARGRSWESARAKHAAQLFRRALASFRARVVCAAG